MSNEFCTDNELSYLGSRTRFTGGHGMPLDDAYRLAHLPLVAPNHPKIISGKDGTDYQMGRHRQVFSLVLPVSADALETSPEYRDLDQALRDAPFAGKIAWHLLGQRRNMLHATICGSLGVDNPPTLDVAMRHALTRVGRIAVEIRGLFSGNVNRGRLYLRVYPERRQGRNIFHVIQQALGRPTTNLYVVGIWNLTDDLDPAEAAALSSLLQRWWPRLLLRLQVDELWLLGARDDLVLDGNVCERLPLVSAE